MDDIIRDFLIESYENLDRLDGDLLALERGDSSDKTVAAVFRTVHTIKGTCGFLGLPRLETVAHRGENVLSLIRDGKLVVTPESADALLRTVDAIRLILGHLEQHGVEGDADNGALLEQLECLATGTAPASPQPSAAGVVASASSPEGQGPQGRLDAAAKDSSIAVASESSASAANGSGASSGPTPSQPPQTRSSKSAVVDSAIRVDVQLLDHVMNLVGELVLARNQILQFAPNIKEPRFANASARLNLLTTELQEGVMKTRMQPIGNAWNKLPRMVRDLTNACGKAVVLDLEGAETELDRTIIEAIKDPLTHAVRNSVDHGIEEREVRERSGKSPTGRLLVRAYHEGGQVNIEVSDDGAGLDTERIRARAVERGLVSIERAAQLGDREIHHMIFSPGFSTAAAVTNVSGRGVGMDVVKTNIERIGGSVDISSRPGQGTTLRIKIPLTLAIIPALVVLSHGQRYAIPQVSLLELVRLEGERKTSAIERLQGTPLYRLRGDLLPLVFLHECLELPAEDAEELDAINIVVLQAGDRQFGLVVDTISDTEEIVVKPLGKELKRIDAFAGATIMGDGQVALIVDVLGIAQRADILGSGHPSSGPGRSPSDTGRAQNHESLLLFTTAGSRMAIPLSLVARLEEVLISSLESSGSGPVVQYRDGILPLVDLSGNLGRRMKDDPEESLNMIVYEQGDRRVGIVVDTIVDIVDTVIDARHDVPGPGTLGSAVIAGRVTDLLDVDALLRSIMPPRKQLEAA